MLNRVKAETRAAGIDGEDVLIYLMGLLRVAL